MRLKRIGGRIELNYSFKTSVFQISRSRARGDVSRARILPRVPRGLPRVRPGPAVTRPALGHQPGAADTRDRDRGGQIFGNTELRENISDNLQTSVEMSVSAVQ